jgi:hypothetical protein
LKAERKAVRWVGSTVESKACHLVADSVNSMAGSRDSNLAGHWAALKGGQTAVLKAGRRVALKVAQRADSKASRLVVGKDDLKVALLVGPKAGCLESSWVGSLAACLAWKKAAMMELQWVALTAFRSAA